MVKDLVTNDGLFGCLNIKILKYILLYFQGKLLENSKLLKIK